MQKQSELKAKNSRLAKELEDTEAAQQLALSAKADLERELASHWM